MNKNNYMSKGEQLVYNSIRSTNGDTNKDIADLFPDVKPYRINKLTSSLSSKGYLYRLKNGTYLVQKTPSKDPIIDDPYKIAMALYKGYIGFSSALRVYDLIDYEPFTIFIVTKSRSREKTIGEYTFKSVAMGDKAVGMTYYKNMYISTIPKTFFDCFYKPQYGGGYSTITKALHEAKIDWKEFINYFELSSDSLCQRTGYVLSMVKKDIGEVPDEVISYFEGRIKNNTRLLPAGKTGGKFVKEWKLMDNLGRENILSWWYHG